jgi:predicted flap endonuclease-1-like 5' DNA nuclease
LGENELKPFSILALGVFGIVFSLFITLTLLYPALPPGSMFEGIWRNLVNGVFYGLIGWLVFAVGVSLFGSKAKPEIEFERKPLPKVEEPMVEVPQPDVRKKVKKETKKTGVPVIDIEGIGPVYAKKLNSVGIYTTSDLLEAGGTRVGRKEISEKIGISDKLVLEWVNLSDLMRIKGVGEEYSDLLEEAGVDTVVELARRNPYNLFAKLLEVNEEKQLVRALPTLEDVIFWVDHAKKLPRKIEY